MVTLLTELIVIVLINLFTLATFARNRHLRKRSTYLVINLTIADSLFGVAAVLSPILEPDILESQNILGESFNWPWYAFLYLTLNSLFPAASLANLSLISLADSLFGVAAVLSPILEPDILESQNILGESFNWPWYAFLYLTLNSLFPAASLANLSLISLERLHATIYPFRHCLIREQVYFAVITLSWLLAL